LAASRVFSLLAERIKVHSSKEISLANAKPIPEEAPVIQMVLFLKNALITIILSAIYQYFITTKSAITLGFFIFKET
jgi:hypothetical protein